MDLGRLEKISLRKQWKKEDTEFTPWLAQEENIAILSDTIGIELEVQGQEENVGPFRADILCRDTVNDSFVLIENQLNRTDHTHLGQLMTYAAGLDAVTIIWIAQKFTEEHRAALDWLNEITNEEINYFGIEIELYKIGKSLPAPMFKLVSKPNDWTKSVRTSAKRKNYTDLQLLQLEYWETLINYLDNFNSKIKLRKPRPQQYINTALGKSGFWMSASVSTIDNTISIILTIGGSNAKENYDKLFKLAYVNSKIKISDKINWKRMDNNIRSQVVLSISSNMKNRNQWKQQFKWFKENLESFDNFFRPLLKKIE